MSKISLSQDWREVDYLGFSLIIQKEHEYIGIDSSGACYSFKNKPILSRECWAYAPKDKEPESQYLCEFELDGVNWKDTLKKV